MLIELHAKRSHTARNILINLFVMSMLSMIVQTGYAWAARYTIDNAIEKARQTAAEKGYHSENMYVAVSINRLPRYMSESSAYNTGYNAKLNERLDSIDYFAVHLKSTVRKSNKVDICVIVEQSTNVVLEVYDPEYFDWEEPNVNALKATSIAYRDCEVNKHEIAFGNRPILYLDSLSFIKHASRTQIEKYQPQLDKAVDGRSYWTVLFANDIDDLSQGFLVYIIDTGTGEIITVLEIFD